MCGRFGLVATWEDVYAYLSLISDDPFPPRYNIAPNQPILMAVGGHDDNRVGTLVRWGLVPTWVKDPNEFTLIINARSETANEKPSFRTAMRHRRTLVPASGWFEWHRAGDRKQPYWIRPKDGGLIAMGGLMETWSDPDGSEVDTGCILTTPANVTLSAVHNRMPVIIQSKDFDRWLDCRTQEPRDVEELMQPANDDMFEAIAVSDLVNKVSNAGPEVLEPGTVAEAKGPSPKRSGNGQMDLF